MTIEKSISGPRLEACMNLLVELSVHIITTSYDFHNVTTGDAIRKSFEPIGETHLSAN